MVVVRLERDTCKEVGKQSENYVLGNISGQALNLAKLKETKYGKRKCGWKQRRLVTIHVSQMDHPANERMLLLVVWFSRSEETRCLSHLYVPSPSLLNNWKDVLMRGLARVRKLSEGHGTHLFFPKPKLSHEEVAPRSESSLLLN